MANYLEQADAFLASLLSDWSVTSTILAIVIVGLLSYPFFFSDEPDTHPLLLARQSSTSPVRNKNESAIYRSPEVPHGTKLKSGLNVKDASAPRWASGKDGDLRDIWREVLRSGTNGVDGKEVPKGLIMTVLGREEIVEHEYDDLSKEIAVIGRQLKDGGVKRVAIYMPNSIEYLLTIFACAFYGLTPILLPFNQPHQKVYELLNVTEADGLISAAGSLPLDDLAQACKRLHIVIWSVEKSSRQMDWNGGPQGAEDRVTVGVWHEMVEEKKSQISAELPSNEQGDKPADLVSIWQSNDPNARPEIVTFSQQNMVSAIAALISALPLRQRFTSADLVLPADSFAHNYALCQTLAALFAHASVAITSVAEPGVHLTLASRSVSPTVIIASAETMAAIHTKETQGVTSMAQRVGNFTHSQSMEAGRMPTDNLVFRLLAPAVSSAGNAPGKLRLILTSERLGAGSPALSSTMLSDLRIFTRARICYALTTAKVAGAVAQTNVFDYRRADGSQHSHFGPPLSSVEIKLVNSADGEVAGPEPQGDIVVSGPAVVGGEVKLGVRGLMREDGTIAYASRSP